MTPPRYPDELLNTGLERIEVGKGMGLLDSLPANACKPYGLNFLNVLKS